MGLLSFIGDLGGKLYRNILSYQIRHSNKPTVTSYEVHEPMRHKKVIRKPATQPVKPPVEIGVEPNIGGAMNPDKATPVAPIMPKELTDKDAKIAELTQKLKEAESKLRIQAQAITEGKIGAVSASKDPTKLQKQVEAAVRAEQKKADTQAESAGLEPVELEMEDDSPDMDDSTEEYTPEEVAAGLPDIPFYPSH